MSCTGGTGASVSWGSLKQVTITVGATDDREIQNVHCVPDTGHQVQDLGLSDVRHRTNKKGVWET